MKRIVTNPFIEKASVVIICVFFVALIFFSRVTELIYKWLDNSNGMLLSEVLIASLMISIALLIVLGLSYRRLSEEVERRKEAEEEVRILRHANKARAAEITLALDENEFQVYYQPIVELKTERICGFEALARWHHPSHGVLQPVFFMPFIEECDLIVSLTKFMLRNVSRQITLWKKCYPTADLPTVSINLSWQYTLYSDILKDVKEVLAEFESFVPQYLCFEFTETTAAQNIEEAIELTKQLRELGITVSIDDFGTGFSSLSYLGDIPATSVKIDRAFIKRMLQQIRSDILVNSIVKMAHELDLKVIAEGVETEEQKIHLLNLNCEYGQGFLFAKPLPVEEAQQLLSIQFNKIDAVSYPKIPLNFTLESV